MKVTRRQTPRKKHRWHNGFSRLYLAQFPGSLGVGLTAEAAKRDAQMVYRELKGKLR